MFTFFSLFFTFLFFLLIPYLYIFFNLSFKVCYKMIINKEFLSLIKILLLLKNLMIVFKNIKKFYFF